VEHANIVQNLLEFVADKILEGQADELDATTPLLEWGVLNSLEMTKLLAHIERTYGIRVGAEHVHPGNFGDLNAISSLVAELRTKA